MIHCQKRLHSIINYGISRPGIHEICWAICLATILLLLQEKRLIRWIPSSLETQLHSFRLGSWKHGPGSHKWGLGPKLCELIQCRQNVLASSPPNILNIPNRLGLSMVCTEKQTSPIRPIAALHCNCLSYRPLYPLSQT